MISLISVPHQRPTQLISLSASQQLGSYVDLSKDTRKKNKRDVPRSLTDPKDYSGSVQGKRSWLGAYNNDRNGDGNSAPCSCKRKINNSGHGTDN